MFTAPSPQYLPQKLLPQSLIDPEGQVFVRKLVDKVMQPLPPIMQGDGHNLGFFGEAIFVGLGMVATSIIGISIGSLWVVLRVSRGKWFL